MSEEERKEERPRQPIELENLLFIVSEIKTLHQKEPNDAEFRRKVADLLELVNQKNES